MSVLGDEKTKKITYKLSFDNEFNGFAQEIVIKSGFQDGIGFEELINGF